MASGKNPSSYIRDSPLRHPRHWNCYPGARVDTEVPQYSYTDPATWSTWKWKQRFPDRDELVSYFDHVVQTWELEPDIAWSSRVTAAHWDDKSSRWELTVNGDPGNKFHCKFFCPCPGFAARAYTPPFKGIESFRGITYHTSEWPQGGADLTGKRVGVIGTGASGVQAIQEIGRVASHITVFQRTPNTCLPMINSAVDEAKNKYFHEVLPEWKKKQTTTFAGFTFDFTEGKAADLSKEERLDIFEKLYSTGGLHYWLGNHADVLADKEQNELAYQFWRAKTLKRIPDPEKQKILAPEAQLDPFGTKRISLEQYYYEVLSQPNAEVVDLRANPIREFTSAGIKTSDGKVHELDVLVMATGFDFVTGGLTRIDLRGIDGVPITEKWAKGVYTYLGMTISGFPNLFTMYGPQAPTAFATGPISAETQGDWIVSCIKQMGANGYSTINPTEEAEQEWRTHVNEVGSKGLFKDASSWYFGDNIPGKPREALNYMAGMPSYREKIDESRDKGWRGFELK